MRQGIERTGKEIGWIAWKNLRDMVMLDEIQKIQREFNNLSDERFPKCRKIRAENKSGLNFREELDRAVAKINEKGGDES